MQHLALSAAPQQQEEEVTTPEVVVHNVVQVMKEDRYNESRCLLVGPGPKAIHIRRSSGEKVVRFAAEDGDMEQSSTALIGREIRILGESKFVTLDYSLANTDTNYVLMTDAAVEIDQNIWNDEHTVTPVQVTRQTKWICGEKVSGGTTE